MLRSFAPKIFQVIIWYLHLKEIIRSESSKLIGINKDYSWTFKNSTKNLVKKKKTRSQDFYVGKFPMHPKKFCSTFLCSGTMHDPIQTFMSPGPLTHKTTSKPRDINIQIERIRNSHRKFSNVKIFIQWETERVNAFSTCGRKVVQMLALNSYDLNIVKIRGVASYYTQLISYVFLLLCFKALNF